MTRMLAWFDRYIKGNVFASVAAQLGTPVAADGWAMSLVGMWRDVKFQGLTPAGYFVQVDLHFEAKESGKPLTLNLPQDAALLASNGRAFPPKGIPYVRDEYHNLALITGQPSVTFEGEKEDTFALTLTFDAPASEHELALRVKDFPLVRVTFKENAETTQTG
jgi:hypothetical protein